MAELDASKAAWAEIRVTNRRRNLKETKILRVVQYLQKFWKGLKKAF